MEPSEIEKNPVAILFTALLQEPLLSSIAVRRVGSPDPVIVTFVWFDTPIVCWIERLSFQTMLKVPYPVQANASLSVWTSVAVVTFNAKVPAGHSAASALDIRYGETQATIIARQLNILLAKQRMKNEVTPESDLPS